MRPKPISPLLENVLAIVAARRRAIGHDLCGVGGAIEHGPPAAADRITDSVKHETLAPVEPHPEIPVLPGDPLAIDLEARPVGLHHVERRGRRTETR